MTMSVLNFLYLVGAIPLERWQCLVYFLTLCDSIVHDVCVCVCTHTYVCVGDRALCMMDFHGYMSDLV